MTLESEMRRKENDEVVDALIRDTPITPRFANYLYLFNEMTESLEDGLHYGKIGHNVTSSTFMRKAMMTYSRIQGKVDESFQDLPHREQLVNWAAEIYNSPIKEMVDELKSQETPA